MELSELSIEVAEEIQRLKKGMETDLKNTKELSELIKKDFPERNDYLSIFSDAYHQTYSQKIPKFNIKDSETHLPEISKQLDNPSILKNEELGKLVSFCVNLSDSSEAYRRYFKS